MSEKAPFIAIPPVEVEGFVGVESGQPVFSPCGDSRGDNTVELTVYKDVEDALNRFFNVRRVRIVVDPEPIRHPEDWGAIDG
jgi:hypothetical protein